MVKLAGSPRVEAIKKSREFLVALDLQIGKIKDAGFGDFRALPEGSLSRIVAGMQLKVNGAGVSSSRGYSLEELTGFSSFSLRVDGHRSLKARLMADRAALAGFIKVAEQALLAEYAKRTGRRLPTLDEDQYLVLDKEREKVAAEMAALHGDEWYLITTPVVLAAQQAEIDATAAKVVKAKDDLKAAKGRLAKLKGELSEVENDVVREDLRRAIRACTTQIDALDSKVDNLSARLEEQTEKANPFLKDGVKLPSRSAENFQEWLSASLPDFVANAVAEIAKLRDQSLHGTYWSVRYDLAEAELPRIVAAVAAEKLPTKCVEHIVNEVKFGRLNLLAPGSLGGAITAQSEITRTAWGKRIPGVNKAIKNVMALVGEFLELATEDKLTNLDAVNRVHEILGCLEGEGKIFGTLAEAKTTDPKWLVNSEGKALLVPNLPKIVVTFITNGTTELSAVSQVKLLPEWFEPPVTDKRSGRKTATTTPVVAKVETCATVVSATTASVETSAKPSARSRI
ncbi:MAG: hypothetical protein NTX48_00110 [Planctomycetales bacterium]|nr:hypothetical protein [Planctomycetales bacterium]